MEQIKIYEVEIFFFEADLDWSKIPTNKWGEIDFNNHEAKKTFYWVADSGFDALDAIQKELLPEYGISNPSRCSTSLIKDSQRLLRLVPINQFELSEYKFFKVGEKAVLRGHEVTIKKITRQIGFKVSTISGKRLERPERVNDTLFELEFSDGERTIAYFSELDYQTTSNNIEKMELNEVQKAVKDCTIKGNNVHPPSYQLDRKLYAKLKKVLTDLGGKWKGGKTQAFIFKESPQGLIEEYLGTGKNKKKELQFFQTPPEVAQKLVEKSDLKNGLKILEPSAGSGALIKAALDQIQEAEIYYCEIWDIKRGEIAKELPQAVCVGFDFLDLNGGQKYDRIIANPPFSKNSDIKHVTKMIELLNDGGKLVTIMSPHFTFAQDKASKEFRKLLDKYDHEITDIEAGAFSSSGTQIATKLVCLSK